MASTATPSTPASIAARAPCWVWMSTSKDATARSHTDELAQARAALGSVEGGR